MKNTVLTPEEVKFHNKKTPHKESYFTLHQIADVYDINIETVRTWYKRGILQHNTCNDGLLKQNLSKNNCFIGARTQFGFSAQQVAHVVRERVGWTPKVRMYRLRVDLRTNLVSHQHPFVYFTWEKEDGLVRTNSLGFSKKEMKMEVAKFKNHPMKKTYQVIGRDKKEYFWQTGSGDIEEIEDEYTNKTRYGLTDKYLSFIDGLRRYELYCLE